MIAIVGFMGAGKTTVGPLVAAAVGLPFVDVDDVIVERHGPIPSIFASLDETGFRAVEEEVVAEILSGPDRVVALGGGALGSGTTRARLQAATVVYLAVGYERALDRIGPDPKRPMLTADTEALYQKRRPLYEEFADVTVATDDMTPREVADRVVALLGEQVR